MSKNPVLRRIGDKLHALGAANTLWFVIDLLLRRLSCGTAGLIKYYFVAQPVAIPAAASARAPGSIRLYVAGDVDATIQQAPRPATTLSSRFDQHSRCVVAERTGELAGFIWLCPAPYREDAVRCVYRWSPTQAAVWDYDVFIAPSFRMGRLFVRLWEQAHTLLAAEGVAWTLSRIDAFNPGSLAAHRKLGACDVARGWFLVIGRMQVTFATVAPYCHVSLHEGRTPTLSFDLSRLRSTGNGQA